MATKKTKAKTKKRKVTPKKKSASRKVVSKKKKVSRSVKKKRSVARPKKVAKKKAAPKRRVAKKVAKKKIIKKPARKKAASVRKAVRKKPVAKKVAVKKKTTAKRTVARKPVQRKSAARRVRPTRAQQKKVVSPGLLAHRGSLAILNYRTLEAELIKLTDLLETIRKKNKFVKKSLAYLEKEEKKWSRQIRDAKKYFTKLKNRGLKALKEFPENAEEIFHQLKEGFNRLSVLLGLR